MRLYHESPPTFRFMEWVDARRTLGVLTNADTPEDAVEARKFGAEGIGLCRTEHMFFASEERIAGVRRMIVAQVGFGCENLSTGRTGSLSFWCVVGFFLK